MASQRITLAKVGGVSAEVIWRRLQGWAEARQAADPNEWSRDQWPPEVRAEADAFAENLRSHALTPPVVHFVEWADLWSMGDLFHRWLRPPGGPTPMAVHADRFEVYGYALPDGGRLSRRLARAGRQQFPEYDQFVTRLQEAVGAWKELVDQAALIVLREVVGGLVTDGEVEASLAVVPNWITEG